MGESFKEFCNNLKKFFANTVYIKDLNNNNPIDFSVREIRIDGDYLYLDDKKISISQLSKNNIIIINGSVEKIENCKNVFVAGDANLILNSDYITCSDVEGDIICNTLKAGNIISQNIQSGNITCENIDGSVKANGDVKCKDVANNVVANGNVSIEGNIGGDVNSYDVTVTGNIEGNVVCKGDLTQKGDIFGDVYESIHQ